MNKKNAAKTFVSTVILLFFGMFGLHMLYTHYFTLTLNCEGIEHFYTNTSFNNDTRAMLEIVYRNNHDQNITTLELPIAIWNNKTVGCKTVSTSILCLSRLYNRTCGLYSYFGFQSVFNKLDGHIGIICLNETGSMIRYF